MTRLFPFAGLALGAIVLTTACGTSQTSQAQTGVSSSTSSSASPSGQATPSPLPRPTSQPPAPRHSAAPPSTAITVPRATAASKTSTTAPIVSKTSRTTSTTSPVPPRAVTTTKSASRPPVPNVVGLSFSQAKSRFQSAGDKYFVLCGGAVAGLPNGTVYSQDPPGGSPSAWNTLVEITVLWAAPIDPTSAPALTSGPIAQKPCPYS